jgi:DNA-cytosine methyltransferase
MNVLSLFDGMSCGQIALNRLKIKYDKYFASEIDKYAIYVTQKNFPETIQLGSVTELNGKDLPKIDLLIGGSPCQGFSVAGNQLNFEDPRSKLFFEFVRILKETKPKYFLLENVKMKKEFQDIITEYLGVNPIEINSALVSAQHRRRLYWTNIPNVEQPIDRNISMKDILDKNVKGGIKVKFNNGICKIKATNKKDVILEDNILPPYTIYETRTEEGKKARREHRQKTGKDSTPRGVKYKEFRINKKDKANCLVTVQNELNKIVDENYNYRYLTRNEYCRLQNVPIDYFDETISDNSVRKMLGNGWTVDVVAHIFKNIK